MELAIIKAQGSAQRVIGVQPAEVKVRVRHCDAAPFAVADRAGIGAGALRSNLQRTARVNPGYRSASGSDGVDVDHGNTDRAVGDDGLAGDPDLPFAQGHVGRSTSHVERQDAPVTCAARGLPGPHHSPRGAAENRAHRFANRDFGRYGAAAGLHDPQSRPPSCGRSPQSCLQGSQIPSHHRRQIGVDDGSGSAFVLTVLGKNDMAEADRDLQALQCGCNLLLVQRIGEREEQADRHRLHLQAPQFRCHSRKLSPIEGNQDAPVVKDALRDADTEPRWDQWFGTGGEEAVEPGPVLAADFEHILKSPCRDQGRPRPLALEQRVGGDRRAVMDLALLRVQDLLQSLKYRERRIGGGREQFERADLPAVQDDEVCKGSAGVDPDLEHGEDKISLRACRKKALE